MNSKELLQAIKLGESETVEFKSLFNKSAIETLEAFSNVKGGFLFIGISDFGEVNGVEVAETVQIAIVQAILDNKYISYESLAEKLNKNRSTIMRNIKKLKELGIIQRVGSDKDGYWDILNDEGD